MPRPRPLQVQAERRGQRQHPHRVGGRRAVDDDVVPVARRRPARRPRAGRAPPGCPGSAESSSGATSPRSDSGNRPASTPATSRQRASSSASVSRASASRNPPPASGVVGEHPRRVALARSATTAVPSTSPSGVRLVGGHDQHPQAGARVAHRGGGRQRRLAYSALADEETDPGVARASAGRCTHSASTRFLRSFSAVSVSLRSALRLSSPIIGMTRSTESS